MIFVSVIRLVTLWFLVRQAPMVTQLTGQVGQLGAIVAAAPAVASRCTQLGLDPHVRPGVVARASC